MAKRFKTVTHTGTVQGAVEGAQSEIESLFDEMEEWASNMEGNNMEHLPKYDEVNEAKDALEQAKDPLDSVDIPQEVADLEVTYQEYRPYGRKPMSRSMRLSNAQNMLSAAIDRAEQYRDELKEADDRDEEDEERDEEVDNGRLNPEDDFEFIDELQTSMDECDNVSFPGMFG